MKIRYHGNQTEIIMTEYKYIYSWGNNEKRKFMKNRRCAMLARGTMNSCMIEFENGQREIVSRNSIRKTK
jgi:hypothetical protein